MRDLEEAYRVLDLPYGAPEDDVRRAWRELTKVWHPDRFGSDPALRKRAEEKQKEINEAYETIIAGGGARFRWPGGFDADAPSGEPEGWAVRTGGRVVPAPDLATILQWLAAGELNGSEDVFDPVYGKWAPLAERPETERIFAVRAAERRRNWAFVIATVGLLLLFRRPTFGIIIVAGSLLAIAVAMLYSWARTIDRNS